ncbi:MAG: DUF4886 domain-containing protein [Clostridia bacterium]|nr:DUF4886 domain-containing protein [Clostridia bacterium]
MKILAIGNSFSDDSMEYLYKIATAEGMQNVTLGNLYIGGCTLATHLSNAQNNTPAYEYRKNTNDLWVTTPNTTLLSGILDEEWDIITMQQASGYSGLGASYAPLDELISFVKQHKPKHCRLAWNMTWAYQKGSDHPDFINYNRDQATMYQAICTAVESKILSRVDFSLLLCPGTAIQNLRTSFVGDTLTRDGYHLSFTLGRYLAAYTWFATLSGKQLTELQYTPPHIIPNKTYTDALLEAINAAVKAPLAVTQSSFT